VPQHHEEAYILLLVQLTAQHGGGGGADLDLLMGLLGTLAQDVRQRLGEVNNRHGESEESKRESRDVGTRGIAWSSKASAASRRLPWSPAVDLIRYGENPARNDDSRVPEQGLGPTFNVRVFDQLRSFF
jgi:hypothetical protein